MTPDLVLATILTLARPPAVDVDEEAPRLAELAGAISEAAEHVPVRMTRADAAMALVAIAHHESGFGESTATCEKTGDDGRSITYFQLLRGPSWGGYTREELCTNPRLAARRALRVLDAPWQAKTPLGLFSAYSGIPKSGGPTKAAREMCASWERLVKRPGACGQRLPKRRAL